LIAVNYPRIVFPGSSSVPPSSLVVPQPKVNLGSPTSVPLSNGHTSCGTPDGSQPLCGNVGANFALYLSIGGEVGVPGPWCIECGSGGGSNNGEGGGGNDSSTAYASDTGGSVSDSSASGEASNTNDASGGVLYRVLYPDEDPALGLVAKDPSATEPVWSHVLNGGKPWFKSQYISTSRSLAILLQFAARRGGLIVEIDESQVIGDIIDISTPEGARAQDLSGKAYGLARHWREVLIRVSIPPEAINWVSPLSDFTLF
jgi:hypothetical protein